MNTLAMERTAVMNDAAIPALNLRLLVTALVAGAFATIGFDLFGQTISPLLKGIASPYLGAKLAPVGLATQSLSVILGVPGKTLSSLGIGHGMHTLTGLLLYPLGYLMIARPIMSRIVNLPWWVMGIVYGVALFVFALYIMAHLVAGNPPFLGWGGLTWVALWGHILFGVIVAGVARYRD
ncbi:MAG: hypothetical protein AAGF28_08915 [Pseudomonadota bacterium]